MTYSNGFKSGQNLSQFGFRQQKSAEIALNRMALVDIKTGKTNKC